MVPRFGTSAPRRLISSRAEMGKKREKICFMPFPQIEEALFLKLNLVVFCASRCFSRFCLLSMKPELHLPCREHPELMVHVRLLPDTRDPRLWLCKPLVAFPFLFSFLMHILNFLSLGTQLLSSLCSQPLSFVLQCPTCLSQGRLHQ